jgi:hypothetical protein
VTIIGNLSWYSKKNYCFEFSHFYHEKAICQAWHEEIRENKKKLEWEGPFPEPLFQVVTCISHKSQTSSATCPYAAKYADTSHESERYYGYSELWSITHNLIKRSVTMMYHLCHVVLNLACHDQCISIFQSFFPKKPTLRTINLSQRTTNMDVDRQYVRSDNLWQWSRKCFDTVHTILRHRSFKQQYGFLWRIFNILEI